MTKAEIKQKGGTKKQLEKQMKDKQAQQQIAKGKESKKKNAAKKSGKFNWLKWVKTAPKKEEQTNG